MMSDEWRIFRVLGDSPFFMGVCRSANFFDSGSVIPLARLFGRRGFSLPVMECGVTCEIVGKNAGKLGM